MLNKDIATVNRETFRDEAVVEAYAECRSLQAGEIAILSRFRGDDAPKRVLDIGVGVGHTTPALIAISDIYVGIDVSPEMITAARQRYPSFLFDICDARDVSRFQDGSFDLVFFSYNGINYVEHSDRLKILREIHRVLAQRGAFVFSSHNRRSLIRRPWTRYYVYRKANPLIIRDSFGDYSRRSLSPIASAIFVIDGARFEVMSLRSLMMRVIILHY
jgi:SAM-dependent methyltransferase